MIATDTVERIRTQANDLFMQYGFRSVSMDDIATKLGMSKKTIYQFYADKDELIDAVVEQVLLQNKECCVSDVKTADNAVHEIFLAIDMVVEMFSKMNPSLLFDMQKYHPNAFAKFQKHKNDFVYNVVKENIVRGIKEELFRADINIELIARFRVETMMLPFNPEFQSKVRLNMIGIHEGLMIQYLFGLASPKGHKLILKYQQERNKK
ncbi:TetR/AcrR family transcriptional regulator [Ferruginibacter albus]|uniref:TetR/AcrR family transcriptional regulator n=1 Tax=Ferruginibacter albus TaxID=2875540 RepID=UPI001CC36AB4|nr:TetR/AcrR family transcriptional regulator [Ferruginibacter albus]UAY52187.1 TetR/AcrR family transcriptional regulator [Ferruginibacter albus]